MKDLLQYSNHFVSAKISKEMQTLSGWTLMELPLNEFGVLFIANLVCGCTANVCDIP